MIGKPKYKRNQIVSFVWGEYIFSGEIFIIDAYGTFEQNEEVSYDILVENSPLHNGEACLYKHIIETDVLGIVEEDNGTRATLE